MSRAQRLLALLQELRGRRRPVTAEALAASLGVSVRTLYRDINELRGQGARIEGEAGLGYVLRPGFLLPPLMFTPDEIEAVLVGLSWVVRRQDFAMEGPARGALAKIEAAAPAETRFMLDGSGLLVGAITPGEGMTIDPSIIRKALRRERKLRLAYRDASATASERTVWPVALAIYDATQVLAAWCELRDDFRHFRLDRIDAVEVLETRPPQRRSALYKAWRQREPDCVPEGLTETDRP
jgi:predicted DNA-binding transcriptional regulator YafY